VGQLGESGGIATRCGSGGRLGPSAVAVTGTAVAVVDSRRTAGPPGRVRLPKVVSRELRLRQSRPIAPARRSTARASCPVNLKSKTILTKRLVVSAPTRPRRSAGRGSGRSLQLRRGVCPDPGAGHTESSRACCVGCAHPGNRRLGPRGELPVGCIGATRPEGLDPLMPDSAPSGCAVHRHFR
jgi:hypothetical protein